MACEEAMKKWQDANAAFQQFKDEVLAPATEPLADADVADNEISPADLKRHAELQQAAQRAYDELIICQQQHNVRPGMI